MRRIRGVERGGGGWGEGDWEGDFGEGGGVGGGDGEELEEGPRLGGFGVVGDG